MPDVEVLDPATPFIDGEAWAASGERHDVIDPFRESPMGSCVVAADEVVATAVASAAAAQRSWRERDLSDRTSLLQRVADLVERDEETLAALVTREMGMPTALARVTQSQVPAAVLRATAACAHEFGWEEPADGATLLRRGAGVVGAITPWNMPVHQIVAKVAAACVAGCSVVLKPSEQTPYDAILLARLFMEAGAPAGLFNVVTGLGRSTGAVLSAHPQLARLSFTGSVGAGKAVGRLAAESLTRCTLELGGKSPALVLDDADLATVVPAALRNGLVNSGQACNAPTRLLLPRARIAEAEEVIVETVRSLVLGDPTSDSTDQGPLVSARQRDNALSMVQSAVAEGGDLLTGSVTAPERFQRGFFVEPTVVTGLAPSARAVREEIFGPVIVIQPFDSEEDAVRVANNSAYALSAEVWSSDPDRARAVGARLEVGQVKINGVRTRNRPMVPFGGMRDSGYGRELGPMGIEEFTDVTAVMS